MGNLNVDALKYIINYYNLNKIPYNINNEKFINNIICNNTVEVLKYIMSIGAKPINSIYRYYIPCEECEECYNGELFNCNYRNLSLEYILLSRYKIKIKDLENNDILDKLIDVEPIEFCYSDFEGDADDNEIYIEPSKIIYKTITQ